MSTYTTDPKQVSIDTLRARIAVLEAFVKAWRKYNNVTEPWNRLYIPHRMDCPRDNSVMSCTCGADDLTDANSAVGEVKS